MTSNTRIQARTLLIAAGAAGFVALSGGFASADPVKDVTGALGGDVPGQAAGAATLPANGLPQVAGVTDTALPAGTVLPANTVLPAGTALPADGLGLSRVHQVGAPGLGQVLDSGVLSAAELRQVPELASLAEIAEIDGVRGVALSHLGQLGQAAPTAAALPSLNGAVPAANGVLGSAHGRLRSSGVPVPRAHVPQVEADNYVAGARGALHPTRTHVEHTVLPTALGTTSHVTGAVATGDVLGQAGAAPEHATTIAGQTLVPVVFVVHEAQGDAGAVADELGSVAEQAVGGLGAGLNGVESLALVGAGDLANDVSPADLEVIDIADLPTDGAVDGAVGNLPETAEVSQASEVTEVTEAADVDTGALPEAPVGGAVEETVGGVADANVTGTVDEATDGLEEATGGLTGEALDTEDADLLDGLV
ncbi:MULTISPECIES: hypothetical protein [Nocardiopsis]|uniref:Uncharacterized protein n=1 Tax=Nocardiopsis sinuspersici TaxID=501010 RepID=A0A1V3C6S9_9ACTN|nr:MULTISPECIES: hypothetical protein [Nocardiopsis]OOC56393.1 hypothetical protein NOSIN_23295 [Nocardiopsis sinuspersici]